jgi:hypothetical protein
MNSHIGTTSLAAVKVSWYLHRMLDVLFGYILEIKYFNCCFSVKKPLLFNSGHRLHNLNVVRSNATYWLWKR